MNMFPPQSLSMIWLGSPCQAFTTDAANINARLQLVTCARAPEALGIWSLVPRGQRNWEDVKMLKY